MKKYILKYGIVASLILTGIIAISFAMQSGGQPDYGLGEVIGYAAMFLSLATIFVAIKQFRDREGHGTISFGSALKMGVLITLIVASVFVVFDALYITVIEPDWSANYQQYTLKQMESSGATEAEIEAMNAQFAAYEGTSGVIFIQVVMFFTVFIIGLLISLISAAVLKKGPTRAG